MAPDPFVSGSHSPSSQEQHELPFFGFIIWSKSGLTTGSGGIPISVILPSCCLEGVKHDQTTNICSLLRQIALAQLKWKFGNKALGTLTKGRSEKDHLHRLLFFYFPTGGTRRWGHCPRGHKLQICKCLSRAWNNFEAFFCWVEHQNKAWACMRQKRTIFAGISNGLPIAKAANKDIPGIPLQPQGGILLFWLSADVSLAK